jgi:hypothetical protein
MLNVKEIDIEASCFFKFKMFVLMTSVIKYLCEIVFGNVFCENIVWWKSLEMFEISFTRNDCL